LAKSDKRKKEKQPFRLQEHVEWVAMAFVLALTVRCFVVEAYKIPSGSMAPTLYGTHYQITCPSCGASFALSGGEGSNYGLNFVCPSCGASGSPPPASRRLRGGDRILVAKDLYLFARPRRWDVFVFKSPEPTKQNTNFVKRLVGLPGERIELRHGQVFIDGRIARKPDRVQNQLWQYVYDGAANAPADCWETAGGWEIRPEGLLLKDPQQFPQTVTYARPILDFYPYNGREGDNVVGDLLVAGHVSMDEAAGSFSAVLLDDNDNVRAVFSPFVNSLTVELRKNGVLVASAASIVASPTDFFFSLSSVDGAHEVAINGLRVIRRADDLAPADVSLYSRSSGVFFEGAGPKMFVSDVKIKRDVYYRVSIPRPDRFVGASFIEDIPPGHFFGLGDNSPVSNDSREWHFVPAENVLGKAFFLFWPPTRLKPVH